MADLLGLSSRLIDSGVLSEPANRVSNELSELADDLAVVESFSHSIVFATGDGLVVFDTSGPGTGRAVVDAVRGWSTAPVHTIVYTHGHVDHVGGSGAFAADGAGRGHRAARVVAHEAVVDRFHRYRRTDGWNRAINARQFGGVNPAHGMAVGGVAAFLPASTVWPTDTYRTVSSFEVGGLRAELHHARGETDDHTWAWLPERRTVCVGDLVTWVFPNAGNPQKVQRWPGEWAAALREVAALGAELLLPAHGLPVEGKARIERVLDAVAGALERLVEAVVAMMNAGATLDEVVASVTVDEAVLALPWMRPVYDEPEFVVRGVWRQFGGWWDGNPARLKPPRDGAVAAEVAALAGGVQRLAARAEELASSGDLRMACQLAEWAVQAAPDDRRAHAVRAAVYGERRRREASLMAKGVFAAAAAESQGLAGDG